MREEVRDIERLQHMLDAANVLAEYVKHHTLEEAHFFNNCNNSHTSPVYSGKKDTKHV